MTIKIQSIIPYVNCRIDPCVCLCTDGKSAFVNFPLIIRKNAYYFTMFQKSQKRRSFQQTRRTECIQKYSKRLRRQRKSMMLNLFYIIVLTFKIVLFI